MCQQSSKCAAAASSVAKHHHQDSHLYCTKQLPLATPAARPSTGTPSLRANTPAMRAADASRASARLSRPARFELPAATFNAAHMYTTHSQPCASQSARCLQLALCASITCTKVQTLQRAGLAHQKHTTSLYKPSCTLHIQTTGNAG
jgi:hypothetical protein